MSWCFAFFKVSLMKERRFSMLVYVPVKRSSCCSESVVQSFQFSRIVYWLILAQRPAIPSGDGCDDGIRAKLEFVILRRNITCLRGSRRSCTHK